MVERLLVVGASLAGLRAVEAARKAGFTGSIILIGDEEHLPYDRPPLSKAFLTADEPADTTYKTEEHLRDDLSVDLRLGAPATALDVERKVVHVGDTEIGYDAVVLATGSMARALPGIVGLPGVHTLRTVEDARAIRAALESGARTVIVGAGFIGSEVAASARKHGLEVTIVEAMPTPLVRAVGETMGAACATVHTSNGTELILGVGVAAVEGDGKVERVVLEDGRVLLADLVVVGAGAIPNTTWLNDSGLTIDNGVIADETLKAADGVYVAGDIARWRNPLFGDLMRLEHWTSAAEQGALAAKNALDPANAKAYSTVPYFWSDQYDSKIQLAGIAGHDEIRVVIGSISSGKFVALYRRGDQMVGALAVNKPTEIMKFRALIGKSPTWDEGLEFAAARAALSS